MTNHTTDNQSPEIVEVEPRVTASVRAVVSMSEIREFFDRSFGLLAGVIERQKLTITGPAFALYRGEPGETADVELGFETDPQPTPEGDVTVGRLRGGRVARTVHVGNYDNLATSWQRLRDWIDDQGLSAAAEFWEVYLTEPTPDADPDDMRTELNWPIAD
ncbi:GyrI-like domain-containing protein [Ilumatobacter sp.]|uniref:GyrI-like domain-containing protein n=1 Tax=Ilumatobacter sp. TaxID=1967498 RepID=UPI003C6621D0